MLKLFLFLSLFSILFLHIQSQYPTVTTPRGTLVGLHWNNGNDPNTTWYGQGDLFLGIPFAVAPVGEFRYKRPSPIIQYPGPTPYNATYYHLPCIQPSRNLTVSSEDCLFVNIMTPNVSSTTKYPVLVFIHGGGLTDGNGQMGYNSIVRNFVSKGIVFVTIEYRMSWLGLFQQAIEESGTITTCMGNIYGPTPINYEFAAFACNYTQEMWDSGNFGPLKDCLMKIDVQDGLKAAAIAIRTHIDPTGCWPMLQDNYFFPGSPQNLWKNRPNIPVITGTCKDESYMDEHQRVINDPKLTYFTKQNIEQQVAAKFRDFFSSNGNQTQKILQLFEQYYLPNGTAADDDHLAWLQYIIDVNTAAIFTTGTLREVEYYLSNNNPNVYTYQFSWSSKINDNGCPLPDYHPVPHSCEMTFVYKYGDWDQTEKDIANFIQETCKPSLDGKWNPTTSSDYTKLEYLEFNNVSTFKTGYRAADQIIWNQEFRKLLGDFPPNVPVNNPICSKGYQSKVKNMTCYEAFGSPVSWEAAQSSCAINSYGSLVTVGSAFENSDLLVYAKNAYPSCTGFYIGLFQSSYTSNWTWANYDLSTYKNWKSGYPTSGSGAGCVVLNASDGTWSNQDCSTPQCYICGLQF